MNLTLDQWNELAYGMVHLTQINTLLSYMFHYSYGKNHKYTKMTEIFCNRISRLQENFEDIVRKNVLRIHKNYANYQNLNI